MDCRDFLSRLLSSVSQVSSVVLFKQRKVLIVLFGIISRQWTWTKKKKQKNQKQKSSEEMGKKIITENHEGKSSWSSSSSLMYLWPWLLFRVHETRAEPEREHKNKTEPRLSRGKVMNRYKLQDQDSRSIWENSGRETGSWPKQLSESTENNVVECLLWVLIQLNVRGKSWNSERWEGTVKPERSGIVWPTSVTSSLTFLV